MSDDAEKDYLLLRIAELKILCGQKPRYPKATATRMTKLEAVAKAAEKFKEMIGPLNAKLRTGMPNQPLMILAHAEEYDELETALAALKEDSL